MRKLAEDGDLPAEEVYVVYQELPEQTGSWMVSWMSGEKVLRFRTAAGEGCCCCCAVDDMARRSERASGGRGRRHTERASPPWPEGPSGGI